MTAIYSAEEYANLAIIFIIIINIIYLKNVYVVFSVSRAAWRSR